MSKFKTTVSIDQVVYDKVKALAKEDNRSFSNIVNVILSEYVRKKERE